MKTPSLSFALLIATVSACSALAAAPGELSGKYTSKSLIMMMGSKPAMLESENVLKIYPRSNGTYTVMTTTVASNGHECDFSGVARLEKDGTSGSRKLVHQSKNTVAGDACTLTITEKNDHLSVTDQGCRSEYCGANGFLESDYALQSKINLTNKKGSVDLSPSVGEKLCYARDYSDDHLKKNKKQTLHSLILEVSRAKDFPDQVYWQINGQWKSRLDSAEVVSGGGCNRVSSASISCWADEDGGQFTATASNLGATAGSVLLTIPKNGWLSFESLAGEGYDSILKGSNAADRAYRLYPVPCTK